MTKFCLWREFASKWDGGAFGCCDGVAISDLDGGAECGGSDVEAVLFCGGVEVMAGGAGVYNGRVVCLVGGGWD